MPQLQVEDVPFAWLESRAEAWDALVQEADRPTPFYARHVVAAHAAHGFGAPTRAVVAHWGERLVALLPYRPRGARVGWLGRADAAWSSPYTTSSTPLVAGDDVPANAAALLDGMARAGGGIWLLPQLTLTNPVGEALRAELERRRWPSAVLDAFERPVLDAAVDHERFLAGLDAGRRKDLRRRRRRLDEMGVVRALSAADGAALAESVAAFLALEMSGWKGRTGTALASRPASAALARALFGSSGGVVSPRADLLTLDDRPVAASLSLVCGGTAYLLKTAYDETLSRVAPGILLEEEIVRSLHETRFARRLDSAAAPGTPLEGLYPGRETVADLLFITDPSLSERAFAAAVARETRRRAWLAAAKSRYRRVRREGWGSLLQAR